MTLLLEGAYVERTRDRTRDCQLNTVYLHPADEAHANEFGRTRSRIFCIEFTSIAVQRLRPHQVDLSHRVQRVGGPAVRLVHRLFQQLGEGDAHSTLRIEGLILETLSEVLSPQRGVEGASPFPWMERVVAFLQATYLRPGRLADVAEVAGVHPNHLARSFRLVHGVTIGGYVRNLRIQDACSKLSATDLPMTEVALACGFSDQSHLSRLFRRYMGVSPRQFRRAHRSR
jgi:AraC family transcriptional regulator